MKEVPVVQEKRFMRAKRVAGHWRHITIIHFVNRTPLPLYFKTLYPLLTKASALSVHLSSTSIYCSGIRLSDNGFCVTYQECNDSIPPATTN